MDDSVSAGILALAIAVASSLAPLTVLADEKDALPPEVEIAFREFSKKAADSRLEKVTTTVEKYAGALAKEVKMNTTAKEKLAEFYPKIVEATQAVWQDRFQGYLRPILAQSPDPDAYLEGWNPKDMARNQHYAWARADGTEAWREALKEVLSPEQLAKYEATENARIEKLRQDLEDYFLSCEDWATSQLEPIMDAEITQLEQFGEIEEGRLAKLKAAAKTAIEETVKDWRQYCESQVFEMEDDMRNERVRNRTFPMLDTPK